MTSHPINHSNLKLRAAALLIALAGASGSCLAWTNKPIKMLVPAPAGGGIDVVARVIADQITAETGQAVIVENKPGAGGVVSIQALRSAPADGQTIMLTASTFLTEIPHVVKTNFDPLKDVEPVAIVTQTIPVLVSSPSIPAKNLKELVPYLKSKPGQLSYASFNAGTVSHYAGAIFNNKAGLDLQHVPFFGSPPALLQVMSGSPTIMFDALPTSLPLLKTEKLRAYGVLSKNRSTHLPNVPTMAEQGYPELDFSGWFGVIVKAGTPPATINSMNALVNKLAQTSKTKERLDPLGFEPVEAMSPAQISSQLQSEFHRNAEIVKTHSIKMD